MKATQKNAVVITLLTSLSILLSSFWPKPGGEGFEIYLNNKRVVQQFGESMNTVKSIQLDKSLSGTQVSVKYYHCGRAGKNRVITIKDANNKTVKEWHYPDVAAASLASGDQTMHFKVADILGLQKTNTGNFKLYYTCNELPKGRLLAALVCETNLAKR